MKNSSFFLLPLIFTLSICVYSQSNSKRWIGGIPVEQTGYSDSMIQKYIDQYTTTFGKKQLCDVLEGGENYRLYIRQELKKRGMPLALEYLPVVESDYNPRAVSRSGAKGLWQFMENSMEPFMKKNSFFDERLDPYISTQAALTKLQDNYKMFKDWPIAIAAYNCGAGAMKKILKNSPVKSFWYISENALLRDQSVQYVPKLLAICLLCQNPSQYDIPLEEKSSSPYFADFDYLETKNSIYLDDLSQKIKLSPEILRDLNPSLFNAVTPDNQKFLLRLPSGMKTTVLEALALESTKISKKIHIIEQGETLYSISRSEKVTVNEICSLNGIEKNEVLSIGKILYIPVKNAEK